MPNKLVLLLCVFAVATAATFSAVGQEPIFSSPSGPRDQEIDRLVGVLKSDASTFEKGQACKRLALLGNERCVPALANLLGDQRLSHAARYALEAIPGPSVDRALRDALVRVEGRQLVGVINSIGVRGDREAVQELGSLLKGPDDDAAAAAAAALAQIATPGAAQLLAKGLIKADGGRRSPLYDANLRCAERLAGREQTKDARRIYESLLDKGPPRQVRLAAALGMLRSEPQAAASRQFSDYLASKDDVKFEAAVHAAPEFTDRGVTAALASALPRVPPEKQVQLLEALSARGEARIAPQIAAVFESGSPAVKMAALVCLGRVGDRSSVPLLIEAAAAQDAQIAATAIESLSKLQGEGIDEELLDKLAAADPAGQRVVAMVLGRRSVAAAAPALLALLRSNDEATRMVALEALGQTVNEQHFSGLLDRIPLAKNEAERQATAAAVDAACRRMPSADAVVAAVAERQAVWPAEHTPALLKVLGAVGGQKALAIVAAAAVEGSPELQDAATRELGRWMTPDAAEPLYKIAASQGHKYNNRALRGYLRIARQFNLPNAERLAMCRKALAIAEGTQERELALEAMERCPSAEAVELASSLIDDAELRDRAVETAIFIGEKIKESDPAAARSAGQKALDAAPSGEFAERARALVSP
jgi:HEAT repeat protein